MLQLSVYPFYAFGTHRNAWLTRQVVVEDALLHVRMVI